MEIPPRDALHAAPEGIDTPTETARQPDGQDQRQQQCAPTAPDKELDGIVARAQHLAQRLRHDHGPVERLHMAD